MGHSSLRDWPIRSSSLAALVLAICLTGIFSLGIEVQRRLDVLTRANSDSIQWALSQLEVELIRLEMQSATPDANIDDLLLRFDTFYSRVRTVRTSPLYADLRAQPEFAEPLDRLSGFLDRAAAEIDAVPKQTALPAAWRAELPGLLADARRMSLIGVDFFARQSDRQREAAAGTLRILVVLTSGLVLALSVLLYALVRLYARGRQQADDIRMTTTRLSTIVTTSGDAIVVSDGRGKVLEFNPAAAEMFGRSRDEALAMRTAEFFPASGPASGAATAGPVPSAPGSPVVPDNPADTPRGRVEMLARRRDGSVFPVELTLAAAESSDGRIMIAVLRDISDRRQTERDLTEARDKALAGEQAKARFLAVMSHEMRTPLNGLLGSAEILRASPLDPDQARLVEVIETSAQVLLHHVSAGLDISRIEAGAIWTQVTGFSMTALVAEVVANQSGLAAAAGNRITVTTLGEVPARVLGNPGQIRQILLNLVGNAVKFTAGGTIAIEIEASPARGDVVDIELRVIDDGIGIAEEDLGRVFDDYVTLDTSYGRPTGGTGLGLGITQRLVRALDGEIGVESTAGAGSVFWVRLPVVTEPAAGSGQEAADAAAAQKLSILVVDDNQINRFVLRSLLEEVGHHVSEAASGQEGVALADAEAHDLILMDIAMPGMNGIEATRRIRAGEGRSRGARIVAVTAHASPDDHRHLQEAGIPDYLIKPVTRGSLSALLAGAPAAPGTVGPGDLPLLDATLLDDLVRRLSPAQVSDLLRRFLAEGDATIARLAAGVPEPEARVLIHRLAGSAATFGATELAAQLQRAEAALGAAPLLAGDMGALANLWSRTRAALCASPAAAERAAERAAE